MEPERPERHNVRTACQCPAAVAKAEKAVGTKRNHLRKRRICSPSEDDARHPANVRPKEAKVYEPQSTNLHKSLSNSRTHGKHGPHDIEFRQSNRSADFIAGVDEAESASASSTGGRLLHTLFSAIETEKDIDNAINQLVFEGVIGRSETEEEIRKLTQWLSPCLKSRTGIQERGSYSTNATSSGRKTVNSEPAARTA